MPHPYVLTPDGGLDATGELACASNGSSWMIRWSSQNAAKIQWWNMPTQSLLGSSANGDAFNGSVYNVDVATDGTAYYFGWYLNGGPGQPALWTSAPLSAQTRVDSTGYAYAGPTRVFDLAGGRKVLTGYGCGPSGRGHTGYLDLGVPVSDSKTAMDFALHGDGSLWALLEPVGSSNQFTLKRITGGALSYTITGSVTRAGTDIATFCHVAASQHFLVITDGKWYTINDDTSGSPGTIKATGTWPVVTGGDYTNLPRKQPTATSFWSNYNTISLATVASTSSVNPSDWLVEDATNETLYDPISNGLVTHPSGPAHVTWRLFGGVGGTAKTRAWGFILDGHSFYVLRLASTQTLVADLTTSQWSRWQSGGSGPLRSQTGMNWQGIGKVTLNKGFSANVVAGDDTIGKLWLLDPNTSIDNDGSGGLVEFPRQAIGAVAMRGRESAQCGAVYLIGSVGSPALTGDTVTLETSDDGGNNWQGQGAVTVSTDVSQELSWLGLGLITAPGRLFRITDSGALSRISSLEMR